jgi:bile acid-coenzyme A ligase
MKVPYARRIRDVADRHGADIAVICGDEAMTFEQIENRSNQLARAFECHGVAQGDFVAICLPNGLDYVLACLAVWKLGGTPAPLNPAMPDPELTALLEEAEPTLVYGLDRKISGYQSLSVLGPEELTFSPMPLPERISLPERALASGGSTGRPKLILPQRSAEYDVDNVDPVFAPQRSTIVTGPLYHALQFRILWGALFEGRTAIVMKRFDPVEVLRLVELHRVDLIFLVPAMMLKIWKLPETVRVGFDVSSLRLVVTGGAQCPQWLFRNWIEWLGAETMMEGYGPSEGIVRTYISGEEWLKRPGSVGKPVHGGRIRILDVDGKDLPPGITGEIFSMPPGGPASTYTYRGAQRRMTDDGWESVGDLGWVDEDGYLYISDRRTDMIVCNGRNIFPAEIEAVLCAHEDIRSAVVIGLPDEERGNRIHAIIESNRKDFDDELCAFVSEMLVRYKTPHSFEYTHGPLVNEAGKVRRSALRQEREAWSGKTVP